MPNTPEHSVTFWSTYKHQVSRPTAFEKTCKTFDAMKHPERPIASSMIGGVAGGIVGTLLFFTKPITSLAVASKDYATRQSIDDESIKAAKAPKERQSRQFFGRVKLKAKTMKITDMTIAVSQ